MPLIAGAFSITQKGRVIGERLVTETSKLLVHDSIRITNTQEGLVVIAGNQELESNAEQVRLLSDGKSVFTGRLFHKDETFSSVNHIPLEAIKMTHGKTLGDHYWGRYILVSCDTERKSVSLYRDPQGLATIFYLQSPEGIFFSSEISLLYDALPNKPNLDWSYLASYIVNGHNVTSVTPFEGIVEARPGCMTELLSDGTLRIIDFWDPTKIPSQCISDPEAFMNTLYKTFSHSVSALSRGADNIVVQLSGGLDSSSVLTVLRQLMPENQNITAVNFMHSQVASSDEREFAKEVTGSCKVPLIVKDLKERPNFAHCKIDHRFNRPFSGLLDHEPNKSYKNELKRLGKQGEIMGGQGGDHLFLAPAPLESVADYFLEKGLWGLRSKVSQISNHYRMPYLRVASEATSGVYNYFRGNLDHIALTLPSSPWMNDDFKNLINPSLFQSHLWDKLKHVPPGKARHIFTIAQTALYVDRNYLVRGKSELYPFLSQPMVELALSMPTYQSFDKGYDRFLFRGAMAKHHTGNYIWRKSKGETSGVLILAMRSSYNDIRDLLLDGFFVKEKLLDSARLEMHVLEMLHGKVDNFWPLTNLINTELWLRSWRG